jgi:hypothetical protein
MTMSSEALAAQLWPRGSGPNSPQAYVLLDGARDPQIAPMVRASGMPFECLYAGALTPALAAAAPYLVQLTPEARFFKELVPKAWGNAWGIFAVAGPDVTLQALRKHFRTLLRVKDEHGQILVFRFYDPRVLGVYVPTCTESELAQLLGPIQILACEADQGARLAQYHRGHDFPYLSHSSSSIRRDQMAVFQRALTSPSVCRLRNDVVTWCAEIVPEMPEYLVRSGIEVALAKLRRYEIDHEDAAECFVRLVIALAPDFDEHPAASMWLKRLELPAEIRVELACEMLTPEDLRDLAKHHSKYFRENINVSEIVYQAMRP